MTRRDDPDTATPARVSTPAELDALPVGSVLLGQSGAVWQRTAFRDPWRSHTDGAYTFTEDLAGDDAPFTLLHVHGRDLLAEAEARGYERGKRDALNEAADAWLRARAAETPGGGACVPIYTPGEIEDEENACVTHEGPWPCETPGGAA